MVQEDVVEVMSHLAVYQGQGHFPCCVSVADVQQVLGHLAVDACNALIHLSHLLKFVDCRCASGVGGGEKTTLLFWVFSCGTALLGMQKDCPKIMQE